MENLAWLAGRSFASMTHRDFDWVLEFNDRAAIVVHCLWRLLETGRISVTSNDDGHQFGLPAPVDAAREVATRLKGAFVREAIVREGVPDVQIYFSSGHVFEIFPDSLGYESWDATNASDRFIGDGSKVSVLHGYRKA